MIYFFWRFISLSWIHLPRSCLDTIGCTATIRRLTGEQAKSFISDIRYLSRAPLVQDQAILWSRLLRAQNLPPAIWNLPILPLHLLLLLPRKGILRHFLLFLLLMPPLTLVLHASRAILFSPLLFLIPILFLVVQLMPSRWTCLPFRKSTTSTPSF